MTIDSLEDILPFVEKPSRYLGSEINIVRKDLDRVKLRFALAFPDLYEIGTSHFGMQILYHILNADPDIAAERVFAPGEDMENLLRSTGRPLFSLESRESISCFDIIGFSLLYELNYTNILTILDLAKIPFLAAERSLNHPLIIAGGPCTCNPEPIAEVFDAIVVARALSCFQAARVGDAPPSTMAAGRRGGWPHAMGPRAGASGIETAA